MITLDAAVYPTCGTAACAAFDIAAAVSSLPKSIVPSPPRPADLAALRAALPAGPRVIASQVCDCCSFKVVGRYRYIEDVPSTKVFDFWSNISNFR